jgi:steroid delta-isomerase-like uncharacterized protein
MTMPLSGERIAARLKIVEEHVRLENRHDLDGIMGTFGGAAQYEDQPWGARYAGRDEVRAFYAALLSALPDLRIEVKQRHVGEGAIVLETIVSGRHRGAWRGLPPTGRPVEFALCGVFTFDAADRLAGERIYYDRAMVLRQLGVFHEPDRIPGRIATVLTHPLTVARIVGRRLFGRG